MCAGVALANNGARVGDDGDAAGKTTGVITGDDELGDTETRRENTKTEYGRAMIGVITGVIASATMGAGRVVCEWAPVWSGVRTGVRARRHNYCVHRWVKYLPVDLKK